MSDLWRTILKVSGKSDCKDYALDMKWRDFLLLVQNVCQQKGLKFSQSEVLDHIVDPLRKVLREEYSSLLPMMPKEVLDNIFRHVAMVSDCFYAKKGCFAIFDSPIDAFRDKFFDGISELQVCLKFEVVPNRFVSPCLPSKFVAYITLPIDSERESKNFIFWVNGYKFVAVCSDQKDVPQFKLTNTICVPLRLEGNTLKFATAYPYEEGKTFLLNMDVDFIPTRFPFIWRFGALFQQMKEELSEKHFSSGKLKNIRDVAIQQNTTTGDIALSIILQEPKLELSAPLIVADAPPILNKLSTVYKKILEISPYSSKEPGVESDKVTEDKSQNLPENAIPSNNSNLQSSGGDAIAYTNLEGMPVSQNVNDENKKETQSQSSDLVISQSNNNVPDFFRDAKKGVNEYLEGKYYYSTELPEILTNLMMGHKKDEPYRSAVILICKLASENSEEKNKGIIKDMLNLCDNFSQKKLASIRERLELREDYSALFKEFVENISAKLLESDVD